MITRLAPTPSGYLHTGNIYNFLLNWLWARSNGGKVLLRIDDGDTERKRKDYVEDIFRVLNWLGLDWDIGPTGPDDFEKNWSQSCRKELYKNILVQLVEKNRVFACDCSRKQECHCEERQLSLSAVGLAWKIKITGDSTVSFYDKMLGHTEINITDTGPFVIKRKDGFAAYQVCSLADDRHFGVTHICRGSDLRDSTAMQLYIDKEAGQPYFNNCFFWHHPLLTSKDGEKFSKSAGSYGMSFINSVKKEALLASFAEWAGIEIPVEPTLESLTGSALFKQ